MSIVVHRV